MSAVAESPPASLYHSPRGLYGFQEDGIARAFLHYETYNGLMACWDTGTGKSHLAMALSAFMIEDGLIDHVILVAEKGKVAKDEWPRDLERFTSLDARVHLGTGRMERLLKKGLPQVLITTYETGKADMAKFVATPGGRGKSMVDGLLLERYLGKRVLIIMDESTKVKNSSADLFKVWHRTITHLRQKKGYCKTLLLTATPIERDYEDAFTQLRLTDARFLPKVSEFETYFVRSRDPFGRPNYHKDREPEFAEMVRPLIMVKRKTDPDIMAEFPKQVEEAHWIEMGEAQRDLYEKICDLQYIGEEPIPGLHTVKRMVAGYPESIIHSATHGSSQLARLLVEEWGEDLFRHTPSAKAEALIDYLKPLVFGQGAKVVVFSFFGPSILPLLARDLRKTKVNGKPFKVWVTHGGMNIADVAEARLEFKTSPEPGVLLCSDAGARGINLPEATYVVEYESALTFANRTQRINRIHRIDSEATSVTCMTFFATQTVEAVIAETMAKRNDQHDVLLGDDDLGEAYITAAERRVALSIARNPKKRVNRDRVRPE